MILLCIFFVLVILKFNEKNFILIQSLTEQAGLFNLITWSLWQRQTGNTALCEVHLMEYLKGHSSPEKRALNHQGMMCKIKSSQQLWPWMSLCEALRDSPLASRWDFLFWSQLWECDWSFPSSSWCVKSWVNLIMCWLCPLGGNHRSQWDYEWEQRLWCREHTDDQLKDQ